MESFPKILCCTLDRRISLPERLVIQKKMDSVMRLRRGRRRQPREYRPRFLVLLHSIRERTDKVMRPYNITVSQPLWRRGITSGPAGAGWETFHPVRGGGGQQHGLQPIVSRQFHQHLKKCHWAARIKRALILFTRLL